MMKLVKNATIYTMDDLNTILRNTDMLIRDNSIIQVKPNITPSSEMEVIDGTGKVVTPGLIDIHTHVGMWGEVLEEINDANQYSEPFTPLMDPIDSINIRHFSFELARKGGVTTVQTGVGSANPIGGTWCILKTSGNSLEEMLLRKNSGLKGALGENPKNVFGQTYQKAPCSRMEIANMIRDGFNKAKKLSESEKNQVLAKNHNLKPFVEVLEGTIPLHLHCHRADDIATAIRLADEFNIKLCLEHCTEGHFVLEAVKNSKANVTLGPFMLPSSKYETRNSTPALPGLFHEAGIPFAIMTDHPFIPINFLIICAAEAVKYGLDEMAALRSITSEAAKLVNLQERIGSIEVSKDADFVIWSGDPFDSTTSILETYINGEKCYVKGEN